MRKRIRHRRRTNNSHQPLTERSSSWMQSAKTFRFLSFSSYLQYDSFSLPFVFSFLWPLGLANLFCQCLDTMFFLSLPFRALLSLSLLCVVMTFMRQLKVETDRTATNNTLLSDPGCVSTPDRSSSGSGGVTSMTPDIRVPKEYPRRTQGV